MKYFLFTFCRLKSDQNLMNLTPKCSSQFALSVGIKFNRLYQDNTLFDLHLYIISRFDFSFFFHHLSYTLHVNETYICKLRHVHWNKENERERRYCLGSNWRIVFWKFLLELEHTYLCKLHHICSFSCSIQWCNFYQLCTKSKISYHLICA
jgi:hypothetical protein